MKRQTPIAIVFIARLTRLIAFGGALSLFVVARSIALSQPDADKALQSADGLKTSNYAEFVSRLQSLEQQRTELTPSQQLFLNYLKGWKDAYDGHYSDATQTLDAVIRESSNSTVKFRAAVTLTNVLVLSRQYERAFAQLDQVLELLPDVSDKDARTQGLAVGSYLFNQVGEYGLAIDNANKLIQENTSGRSACYGQQLKLQAVSLENRSSIVDPGYQFGIDTCTKWGEKSYANAIRTYLAQMYLNQHSPDEALQLLNDHYPEVVESKYPRLISQFDALLAAAYREKGDSIQARKFALRTAEDGVKEGPTEPLVNTYRLLYVLEKEGGDVKSALAYHEKYLAADRAYLSDSSARQLAYQRVKHEVAANKLQIEALNQQNEVLKLQQQLGDKAVENFRLYIGLSTVVLCFILLWAYFTKRSQMHFMKLSRQDGLTGLFNRPHFIDQSVRALNAAKKTGQTICVVICDLDYFKAINDNLGHATGDAVLRQTADAFQSRMQKNDIVGRLGGEEFGLLFVGCDMAESRERCERLRTVLADIVVDQNGSQKKLSASFGISTTATSGHEFRQLLAHADSALYRAKRTGRDRVVLHGDDGADHAVVEIDAARLTA